ncbi:MAG: methylmalonyl-CoA mutase family protein [SAR324 cluster bacterium]|nr:methylmalonyl-CoA mutase family protein [SAR324 cluster bacterium]
MTDSSPTPSLRFVTATSLFDGHDASINIIRRILQDQGAEVIHLGHNRGVQDIVNTAIQEDAQGIAISSYQGGHMEFFKYMVDLLKDQGASHIKVFGGGGGVIIPREIKELMEYGVARIYSPEDGRQLGLEGMIADMLYQTSQARILQETMPDASQLNASDFSSLAQSITWLENHVDQQEAVKSLLSSLPLSRKVPVIGITGTGGAGKSCLTDEIVRRFLMEFPEYRMAVISVDPTRRRTHGALLGDRLRMNAIESNRVFMRSMATRRAHYATSAALEGTIHLTRKAGFDLILVETAGIGQSDTDIIDLVDLSVYVMTPEFGAATQLEKIDMLDYADLIVLNKFDKPGADDALKAVQKQYQRNRHLFETPKEQLPVFGTIASRFNDVGTNWFYHSLIHRLIEKQQLSWKRNYAASYAISSGNEMIPASRRDYLRNIALTVRDYKEQTGKDAQTARECYQLYGTLSQFGAELPEPFQTISVDGVPSELKSIVKRYNDLLKHLPADLPSRFSKYLLQRQTLQMDKTSYQVRDKVFQVDNFRTSLAGTHIPKVAVPSVKDWGDIYQWINLENFPGEFPYTAGVFPFKREGEDPTRMFAGEGLAERTNRRFHFLSKGQKGVRLSTAFDSVTLYGSNPENRPDILGKVGNSGVSIPTVDDAKRLYSGFDLCDASTSVSMTINGPAPMVLAFFMNAAIDQQVEQHLHQEGQFEQARHKIEELYHQRGFKPPRYRGELPEGHNGTGIGTLGVSGHQLVSKDIYHNIRASVLQNIRGTVQADILKEDQAQNTCIFSTTFALKMMGDIQEYFIKNKVNNFYSVSISGYHIAEAGANPISQAAFTLANGFTFIEYYLSRGMSIDQFAHNLSFFFSNGMDPEYNVIGRVARRIFALALKNLYHANERSQKLKYHIQTSGRSLHAQEIDFNDIRTTIQALYAIYDNCNSLHTNAYDEAITTPTAESVRRALAIQLIINRESGLAKNENPLQGSFIIEELTQLVEEAILSEFVRLSDRGGVLGAMETMYQRNKIQEESMYYEHLKHSGEFPIIGVNTFLNPNPQDYGNDLELARSTDEEKESQLVSLEQFHKFHQPEAERELQRLGEACEKNHNLFDVLMDVSQVCSLGQISQKLYRHGGQYRRNM